MFHPETSRRDEDLPCPRDTLSKVLTFIVVKAKGIGKILTDIDKNCKFFLFLAIYNVFFTIIYGKATENINKLLTFYRNITITWFAQVLASLLLLPK